MGKVHLDRLAKKFPAPVKGQKYQDLIKQIIGENTANLQKGFARRAKKEWKKIGEKYSTKERRVVLPNEEEVIPKRALHVRKAAEKGEMIRDTLRDNLTKDLRDTLFNFDEERYITSRGAKAGRINPKLIKEFEGRIKKTFSSYTKKDPSMGAPPNVHNIAVTEARGAINQVKKEYTDQVEKNNPQLEFQKVWIHNASLSEVPRKGHRQMDGKRIGKNELYMVPLYRDGKKVGATPMLHPHDPDAPPEQVIGCNCDYDIFVKKKRKK